MGPIRIFRPGECAGRGGGEIILTNWFDVSFKSYECVATNSKSYDRSLTRINSRQELMLAFQFGIVICKFHLPKSAWFILLVPELRRRFHPSLTLRQPFPLMSGQRHWHIWPAMICTDEAYGDSRLGLQQSLVRFSCFNQLSQSLYRRLVGLSSESISSRLSHNVASAPSRSPHLLIWSHITFHRAFI